jgi:LytS/YehU family sensor histidine kinase
MIIIVIVTFALLREAFFSIPDDWLFFFTSDAIENFMCTLIAYGLYFYVFNLNGIWKKIGFVIGFISLLIAISSLKDYRIRDTSTFEHTFEYFTSFLGLSLVLYSGIYFLNRLEFLNRYKKLENELNRAKAQLLRNQLHPHFLFNAFNSLYSLSLKKHPETPDYILKLSSMMRFLTDETDLNKIRLNKEIDFIEKYIAIEKIRFGKDVRIKLNISNVIKDSTLIEPFLLITLVENAFKHGFYTNSKDAYVYIDLNIEDNKLLFTVQNSVFKRQHFQNNTRDGKGLKNLKQRLNLLYPKSSSLWIKNNNKSYITKLTISLN